MLARLDDQALAYELHVRDGGVTYPIRANLDAAFYPRRLKAQTLYLIEYGMLPPLRKLRSLIRGGDQSRA